MRRSKEKQKIANEKIQRAFTLVEVIIVVAILGVMLQIVSAILVTIMRQQTAIIRFGDVKKEGDQVLARMKSEIQTKARGTYNTSGVEICTGSTPVTMTNQNFRDAQGNNFRFLLASNRISFVATTTDYLTSTKSNVTNFVISCARPGTYARRIVSIDFDISSTTQLMFAEGNPTLHYSTKILLKE